MVSRREFIAGAAAAAAAGAAAGAKSAGGKPAGAPAAPAPQGFDASEPAPVEDLPQEYYDMLSEGWESANGGAPW